MKKIVFIFLCLFILSGCTSKYELKIDGDQFDETITTYIYPGDREYDMSQFEDTLDYGDRIEAFINRDSYPFFENYDFIYDKKVEKIEDYEKVQLKYKYTAEEFKKSNAINLCFHNFDFKEEKDRYIVNLGGYFYCLYNNTSLDVIIQTKNEVFENNANEVDDNKYIWHINQDNYKDVNIYINISNKKSNDQLYMILFGATLSLIIIIIIVVFFINKRRKEINEF